MSSWTPKIARARTRRRIRAFEAALAKFTQGAACDWGDDDQYIVNLCDEIERAFDEPLKDLHEALDDHVEGHELEG
jgi:hypothetical protein